MKVEGAELRFEVSGLRVLGVEIWVLGSDSRVQG